MMDMGRAHTPLVSILAKPTRWALIITIVQMSELRPERLSDLPEDTQLIGAEAWIGTHAVWLLSLCA